LGNEGHSLRSLLVGSKGFLLKVRGRFSQASGNVGVVMPRRPRKVDSISHRLVDPARLQTVVRRRLKHYCGSVVGKLEVATRPSRLSYYRCASHI
jgi:hypothetical protein